MTATSAEFSFEHAARRRREYAYLRALYGHGWEGRLRPLATHMAAQRLVRARGEDGGALRRLDLDVLCAVRRVVGSLAQLA